VYKFFTLAPVPGASTREAAGTVLARGVQREVVMTPLGILDRLLKQLGYVRLKAHGYALTPTGRIVEIQRVDDDRFEPPPFSVVPFQSPVSMLPPMAPPKAFPTPRPLPPSPEVETAEEPQPLFTITTPLEPAAPAEPTPDADEEIDEEEWEWKMAMARARASAPAGTVSATADEAPRAAQRPGVIASRNPAPALPPRRAAAPPSRAAAAPSAGKTPVRAGLEKSVARVFPTPQPRKPLPERPVATRMARGTQGAQRAVAAPHTVARADGTPTAARPAAAGKRAVGEDTATDITAVDRAWQSMRDDEATRVNVVSAPALAAAIDDDVSIDEATSVEETRVDPALSVVQEQAPLSSSPLPRLSARLRRPSA
jgi:hypothetical protein